MTHEHRLLHQIQDLLTCVLEGQERILEAIEASAEGDPALAKKIQRITKIVNQSTAALKAKVKEVDEKGEI